MKLAFWKKSDDTAGQVDFGRLPRHIAVILDGNGRWAQRRGLPRTAGHKVGSEPFRTIDTMERDNVRLRFMGDMTPLSGELRELVDRCNAISDRLTGCLCSICINYGGRAEIVHGARAFAKDCAAGAVKPEDLTEEMFENYLYSAGIPSPDLLIRPGGELRLSNFLLWQCAYTEIYVTDVLWPDFSKEELHRAIASYQRRDRRFGGVKR